MSMFKYLVKLVRRIVEGILLWPVVVIFLVFLAGLMLCRPGLVLQEGRRIRKSLKRWSTYAGQGLCAARNAWWSMFKMAGSFAMLRLLFLLEVLEFIQLATGPRHVAAGLRRILVIQYEHFGDLLHSVPVLRALRKAHPNAELDVLIGPWCENAVRTLPYVTNVWAYTPALENFHRGQTRGIRSLVGEIRFLGALRQRAYDLAVLSYDTNLVDLVLLHGIAPKAWLGTPAPPLYTPPGNANLVTFEPQAYESERRVRMLKSIGIDEGNYLLEYPIRLEDQSDALRILQKEGVTPDRGWVVICPGSGWSGKNWLPDRFAAVADQCPLFKYNALPFSPIKFIGMAAN